MGGPSGLRSERVVHMCGRLGEGEYETGGSCRYGGRESCRSGRKDIIPSSSGARVTFGAHRDQGQGMEHNG